MGLLEGVDGLTAALPDVDDWSRLSEADKDRFDAMMAVYAAAVARFDKSVGDVVAHLEERGTLDDTIIFILSDNGGNAESGPKGLTGPKPWGGRTSNIFVGMNWATLQNTPFRFFKHFTAEGGIATPLIVHWPAGLDPALAGSFVRTPGHVIDLMPTLTAVTGAEYPASFEGHDVLPMEGVSLLPALSGAPIERPWPLFWEHEGNKAVRDRRWKALQRLGGAWELYDLETDRTELRDLAAREPDRLSRMIAAWDAWAERTYVDPWIETEPRSDWGSPLRR